MLDVRACGGVALRAGAASCGIAGNAEPIGLQQAAPARAAVLGALFLGLLSAVAPIHAEADRPDQYAATASLAIEPGTHGLVRVPLSLELLRELRTGARNDIRVFNGAGEAVPYAWAGTPSAARSTRPPVALTHFRWPAVPASASAAEADVRVEIAKGGHVVSVERRGAAVAGEDTASARWLLDLTPVLSDPPAALRLHWSAAASPDTGTVAAVHVEASADARRWRAVGEATVLGLRDAASGEVVAQRRVALTPLRAGERYLRIVLTPPLVLERVEAEPASVAPPRSLARMRFTPKPAGVRTWTVDTGAVLPIARMQVHVAQDNAVLPLAVSHRAPSDMARGTLHESGVWSP